MKEELRKTLTEHVRNLSRRQELDDTLKRAEEKALHVCSDECNPGNCELAHNREFGWDQ